MFRCGNEWYSSQMTTPSRSIRVSPPAQAALDELKQSLDGQPHWIHSTTTSVMIEFLCWFRKQARSMGEIPGYKGFRPKTRVGRPIDRNVYENLRPADMRKAAGLSKTEARLGPKPPKL